LVESIYSVHVMKVTAFLLNN